MTNNKNNEALIYKIPDEVRDRVRTFMIDFLQEHEITKTALVKKMNEELGRSASKTAMIDKFTRASFKLAEVMEILDLYGYELKIVPKQPIEHPEGSKIENK